MELITQRKTVEAIANEFETHIKKVRHVKHAKVAHQASGIFWNWRTTDVEAFVMFAMRKKRCLWKMYHPWGVAIIALIMASFVPHRCLTTDSESGNKTAFDIIKWYLTLISMLINHLVPFKQGPATSFCLSGIARKIREAWTYSMLTLMPCELSGEAEASSMWICSLVSSRIPEDNSIAFFFLDTLSFFVYRAYPSIDTVRRTNWFIMILSLQDFRQIIHIMVDKNAFQSHLLTTAVALWKQEKQALWYY